MSFEFTNNLDDFSLDRNNDPLSCRLSEKYYRDLQRQARQDYVASLREPFTPAQAKTTPTERIRRMIRGRQNFIQLRLNVMKAITSDLGQISGLQGRMCFRNPIFYAKFADITKIGEGTFGDVYLGTLNNNEVIIKEAALTNEDTLASHEEGPVSSQYWTVEYSIAKRLNDLVISKRCPNFMLTYDLGLCRKCRSDFKETICSMTFMEPASFDLAFAFEERVLGSASQLSLLAQLLIALYYVQETFQIVHSDIKAQNILILETPTLEKTLLAYKIKGSTPDTFMIENTGLILCLGDFGVADKIGPHSTFKYSIQNGLLKPYISGMTPTPSEYGNDVLDCIRTFLGRMSMGKRTVQPGAHKGYLSLDPKLMGVLQKINEHLPTNLTSYAVTLKPDQAYLLNPILCLRKILTDLKYTPPILPVSNKFG